MGRGGGEESDSEAPPPFRCPACGERMTRGVASIHGTFVGFLVFGFSHQKLWFVPEGERREHEILGPSRSRAAQGCASCGALFLFGPG